VLLPAIVEWLYEQSVEEDLAMSHDNLHERSATQTRKFDDLKGHLEIEDRGVTLIVRVDGGPHALFGAGIASQLEKLVDRVEHDPRVHAVVITGTHPQRFISHADVRWLQEGGAATPSMGQRGASAIPRAAEIADRTRVLEPVIRKTRCREPSNSTGCTRCSCR
jgi:hypothetical protein